MSAAHINITLINPFFKINYFTSPSKANISLHGLTTTMQSHSISYVSIFFFTYKYYYDNLEFIQK